MNIETNKLLIAIEYLDTSSKLWLEKSNYFSAMHLAAAAEEISGKACRIADMNSSYDDMRLKVLKGLNAVGIEYTEKEIRDAFYSAKNSVKHMDSRNDSLVNIAPKEETADYIISAYRNFEKLELQNQLSEATKKIIDETSL